jgi:hypothetical protein
MFVEVRYRGLRLAEKARFHEAPDGGFVELEAPMPVGTSLAIVVGSGPDGEKPARVIGVVEQEAGAKSPPGVKVAWDAVPAPIDAADSDGTEAPDEAAPGEPPDPTQDASPGARKRRGNKKKTLLGRP